MADKKGGARITPRALALDVLIQILEKGEMTGPVLTPALAAHPEYTPAQRAFTVRLVEGTVERCLELDYVLDAFSRTPVRKMKPVIREILRMGVYQLLYMDAVPDGAVVNEAVNLAASRGLSGLKGYVNGVLRAAAGGARSLPYPPEDTVKGICVRTSMPEWIVERFVSQWGMEKTALVCEGLLKERPLVVHVNCSRASLQDVRESLASEGVSASVHPYSGEALILTGAGDVTGLTAFRNGSVTVQDIGSQLAAAAAAGALLSFAGAEGESRSRTVLDVCAAPGGKALYVADSAAAARVPCEVTACDVSEEKIARIRENLARTGLKQVRTEVADARIFRSEWEAGADLVIADVPCSGLGITGRKNDIKYRMSPGQMEDLVSLQREILTVSRAYVRPGGVLAYSTCTLNEAENQENFAWFLRESGFVPLDVKEYLPPEAAEALAPDSCPEGQLQLLPGIHDSEGFFLSLARRPRPD